MSAPFLLIIDDDPGALEAFEPVLKFEGYRVRVAGDAEAGLKEIEGEVPSAIVLDLHLPTMDGLEFLRRLRSTVAHAGVPIAVVTGDYLIDDYVTGEIQTLGAKLFFKPIWEDDLIQIVRNLVTDGLAAGR